MAKPKLTDAQWADVQAAWTATNLPVLELSRRFGVSDTAINKRADKFVWGPRNAAARKRAMVEAAAAGLSPGLKSKPPENDAERGMQDAVSQDIEAMAIGSDVALTALRRCKVMLGDEDLEPRDFKHVVESGRLALEMYRRARNLDEPNREPEDESPLLALAKSIGEARASRPQTA